MGRSEGRCEGWGGGVRDGRRGWEVCEGWRERLGRVTGGVRGGGRGWEECEGRRKGWRKV